MKVLFVDDELRVLEAIERVLVEMDAPWEMTFVSSGEQALVELDRLGHDVVFSDLRMAGMDGVTLLTEVAKYHPRTVRIVLSGHSDEEAALKMVHVAHQFLAKPCSAEMLHHVIGRTQELTRLLPDRKLQTLAGQVSRLPSNVSLQRELTALLDTDTAGSNTAQLATLIKRDPGMASKLLQVASSAFFNSSASVTDVESAIMRLGFRTLKNLMLTLSGGEPASAPAEELQRRSLAIAKQAAAMARLPEDAAAAYIAGLFCDVGRLALLGSAPERLYLGEHEAARRGIPAHVAERETWGASHADLGGYLLGLWGLPFQIVEAVANHHTPERSGDSRLGLPQLVWLAACIVEGEEPAPDLLSRFGAEEIYATRLRAFQEGSL